VLGALAQHNAAIYRRNPLLGAPWSLVWIPDQIESCDAKGCRLNDTSTLVDVIALYKQGYGSCGPLACAYAGYLQGRHNDVAARVRLLPSQIDPDIWHAVAENSNRVYDPQQLGGAS